MGRWGELAVCPLHQALGRRHFPLTKRTPIPVTPRKMCNRRDRDGRNGHRNYIMTGECEVWVLQEEWINNPQYKRPPVAFLCSWRQTKAVTPLHMATKLCSWRPASFSSLWRGRGNVIPVTYPRPNLSSPFFSCSASFWVPQLAQSKSLTSFQLPHCPFSACGSPSPAPRAGQMPRLHHHLLSWSPNKLLLAPQIVFQV